MQKYDIQVQFTSVTQLCPTLQPHRLHHTRSPCPLPAPGAYSNSCPLSQWCHPTISSSVVPFNLSFLASLSQWCHPTISSSVIPPSIFPSNRVFSNESVLRIRWLKYWSFSFSVSPSNEYSDWFPTGWTGWISKGLSRAFSNTTVQNH